MRPLPTADLNGSMGISVGVLLLMIYYGIKIRQCQTFTCGSKLCLILTDAITDKIEAEDSRCLK